MTFQGVRSAQSSWLRVVRPIFALTAAACCGCANHQIYDPKIVCDRLTYVDHGRRVQGALVYLQGRGRPMVPGEYLLVDLVPSRTDAARGPRSSGDGSLVVPPLGDEEIERLRQRLPWYRSADLLRVNIESLPLPGEWYRAYVVSVDPIVLAFAPLQMSEEERKKIENHQKDPMRPPLIDGLHQGNGMPTFVEDAALPAIVDRVVTVAYGHGFRNLDGSNDVSPTEYRLDRIAPTTIDALIHGMVTRPDADAATTTRAADDSSR